MIVTAQVGKICTKAKFTIEIKSPRVKEKPGNYDYNKTDKTFQKEKSNIPTVISPQGKVTPRKWMQFNTKVISKFATNQEFEFKL